jgi:hypothetical protein
MRDCLENKENFSNLISSQDTKPPFRNLKKKSQGLLRKIPGKN